MKLQLTRPLAAFDIESTSAKPLTAKIIELAIIKIFPTGYTSKHLFFLNPGEPIPAEATEIHGFNDEMVIDCQLFKDVVFEITDLLKECDFLTFNGNSFDIPLLNAEFERAGVKFDFSSVNFIDAGNLFKIMAPRTLGAAVLTYLGKELEGAHGAISDTQATIDVLEAMLDKHSDEMPLNVSELAFKSNFDKKRLDLAGKFSYNKADQIIFTFGKHKDTPVNDNLPYVEWMLGAKDAHGNYSFSEDTRNVMLMILGRESMIKNDGAIKLPKFVNPKYNV